MKRITPDQVKAILDQEGNDLCLVRGTFGLINNCTCPIGVLFIAATGIRTSNGAETSKWAEETYGFEYVDAFWRGFDNESSGDGRADFVDKLYHYHPGYQDGRRCAKELDDYMGVD